MKSSKKKTFLICFIILLAAVGITVMVFSTEPTAKKAGATKKTAMLVETVQVKKGDFDPVIIVTGNVQPSKEILLSPRVNGQIVQVSKSFTPGGFVQKGEKLVQIDPADFKNNLELRKSELLQAKVDLQIEQGRQDVAKKDYKLVEDMVELENTDLVLRQPQLDAIKARVKAAEAAYNQAKLNVQRTSIKAPFDAHILSRNVNLGSQVAPGNTLARLVGTKEYWVMMSVPLSKLPRISFPDATTKGSEVKIIDQKAWAKGAFRTGYVIQLMGALEGQTRMARILVAVQDPLAYQNDSLPALIINSFVEAQIKGQEVKNVVRISRDYLRENKTVWVKREGKLNIRKVKVKFMDAQYVYVSEGLKDNEQVVTTNLSTITEGVPLRTEAENDTTEQQETSTSP